LRNSFGEPFWRTGLQNSSFGAIALENSFGAQLWGAAPGISFGEQLWTTFWTSGKQEQL